MDSDFEWTNLAFHWLLRNATQHSTLGTTKSYNICQCISSLKSITFASSKRDTEGMVNVPVIISLPGRNLTVTTR